MDSIKNWLASLRQSWQKKLQDFFAKLLKFKSTKSPNELAVSDKLDRKLVFHLSKKLLPSLAQLKTLSRFLTKK